MANLTVKSPSAGVISNLYVSVGDTVGNNTKIADVVDKSTLTLKIPFNAEDAKRLNVGDTATVNVASSLSNLSGIVTKVYSGERVLDGYITVTDVEIEVTNPGSLTNNDIATAVVGDIACNSPATFSYKTERSVMAKSSGEVSALPFGEGDSVQAGSVIARLTSHSAELNARSSALNVQDSELALQNLYDQRDDYNITSPISGKIISKTYRQGDTLDGNNSATLAVVADLSQLIFTLNLDELDIAEIEVGQEVTVTADALSGQVFQGVVENVSVMGTTNNGTTTYPVKVVINEPGDLLPGMNVDAEIVVESKEDVLMVPVSAVQRGNQVLVKTDKKTSGDTQNGGGPMG